MKIKVSVSMENRTLEEVENKVKGHLFRNKSRFIEYAAKKCLEGDN